MVALISSLFRTIIILYLYKKLLTNNPTEKNNSHLNHLFMIGLFLISAYTHVHHKQLLPLLSISAFSLYAYIVYKNKAELAFLITAISYTLYYAIYTIVSLCTTTLLLPFYYFNLEIPYTFMAFIDGLLTYILFTFLFKIKRLQSGTAILTEKKFQNLGISISLLILLLKTVDSMYISSKTVPKTIPFATILLAILLFIWWQKQITKSYITKLRRLEIHSLYNEIEYKERQIQKLSHDNEALARIIHKDNKLIPAMEHAVASFLSSGDFHNSENAQQYGFELTQKLHTMTLERQEALATYENKHHKLHLTGHVGVDAILVYMMQKAETNDTVFECRHTQESIDYMLTKISEDDLTHLLSDLIENAIIALSGTKNGRLQITFGKLQKEAYLSIADNGIPFEIETLHSFGRTPHTTHADSGGSGIGLMDIWRIKRKYRATIQIQEYTPGSTGFSKRILFSFNSKNHYVIQSFRHTELINTQTRGDLYVIPAETNEKNEEKHHEQSTEALNS